MMGSRRQLLVSTVLTVAGLHAPALAQDTTRRRPIRLVLAGAVATAADLVGRLLAERLGHLLEQTVVVENRSTANGAIAGAEVARAAPDGHTLLLATTSAMVVNPHLIRGLGWHPLRDFTAIAEVGRTPSVVATSATSIYRDFQSVVLAARTRPDEVTVGVLALTLSHFLVLALQQRRGMAFSVVPYTAQSQMVAAVLSGHVDLVSTGAGSLLPFFQSGDLRPLVLTGEEGLASLPEVPTIGRFAPGLDVTSWFGLFGPARLDPATAHRINAAVNALLAEPGFREELLRYGTVPSGGTPVALAARVRDDLASYDALVTGSGLAR